MGPRGREEVMRAGNEKELQPASGSLEEMYEITKQVILFLKLEESDIIFLIGPPL